MEKNEKDYEGVDVLDERANRDAWKFVKKTYTWDDAGYAHVIDPRYEARKKGGALINKKTTIDPDKDPSIMVFSADGRHAVLTKNGFDCRDKTVWFPSEKEALEYKNKSLTKKKKEIETELKERGEEAK